MVGIPMQVKFYLAQFYYLQMEVEMDKRKAKVFVEVNNYRNVTVKINDLDVTNICRKIKFEPEANERPLLSIEFVPENIEIKGEVYLSTEGD
jgi:hypothetical protein